MMRALVPGGQFVETKGGYFTVTAYDLVSGQFFAEGHRDDQTELGEPIWPAEGYLPDGEGETLKVRRVSFQERVRRRPIGIITEKNAFGVTGLFYQSQGEPALTAHWERGEGELLCDALPEGRMKVFILEKSRVGGDFIFRFEQKILFGMSGSPILQKGRLVGALWGESENKGVGTDVEKMADALLGEG